MSEFDPEHAQNMITGIEDRFGNLSKTVEELNVPWNMELGKSHTNLLTAVFPRDEDEEGVKTKYEVDLARGFNNIIDRRLITRQYLVNSPENSIQNVSIYMTYKPNLGYTLEEVGHEIKRVISKIEMIDEDGSKFYRDLEIIFIEKFNYISNEYLIQFEINLRKDLLAGLVSDRHAAFFRRSYKYSLGSNFELVNSREDDSCKGFYIDTNTEGTFVEARFFDLNISLRTKYILVPYDRETHQQHQFPIDKNDLYHSQYSLSRSIINITRNEPY